MGTIKDRNGMDLTEAEDIQKRWQEYSELHRKDLCNRDIQVTGSQVYKCTQFQSSEC